MNKNIEKLNYWLMVLYHKIKRDDVTTIMLEKGFRWTMYEDSCCMYCSKTIKDDIILRPMINAKKEISFACIDCLEKKK